MKRRHGHLLMWAGFLGASLSAMYRGEQVPWTWYLGWLALGVLGVIVLRATSSAEATHEHRIAADLVAMRSALETLTGALAELIAEKDATDVYDVHGLIDERMALELAAFADARESMIPRFGLDEYAEIMTRFAGAERMINRAWSASADGYIDEVWISLGRARVLMSEARRRFEAREGRSA